MGRVWTKRPRVSLPQNGTQQPGNVNTTHNGCWVKLRLADPPRRHVRAPAVSFSLLLSYCCANLPLGGTQCHRPPQLKTYYDKAVVVPSLVDQAFSCEAFSRRHA